MGKKLVIGIVLSLVLSSAVYSQVSFGIRGGVNFQNLNGKEQNGDKLENSLKVGFHAGVEAQLPVADDFFLQPGLLFSTKGASDLGGTSDRNVNLSYIELPVHFAYKPLLGTGRLIVGIGPYFAYGLKGKIKQNDLEEDIKFTNDITESSEGLFFLRPFDAGADIFFGYELDMGLFAQVNAQLGLLNLMPKFDGETSDAITKNTGFGLSVGYRF